MSVIKIYYYYYYYYYKPVYIEAPMRKMQSFQLALYEISLTSDRRYFGNFWDAGDPLGCIHI